MLNAEYDKKELRSYVSDLLSGKIKTLEFYREFTLEASKDIKKTAKYDSFREEIQEELYHLDRQMHTLKTMRKTLARVISSPTEIVQLGSLVITNKARFYICISLGEFFFNGDRFYAISEESPMAKMMKGKRKGSELILNNIHQKIEKVI